MGLVSYDAIMLSSRVSSEVSSDIEYSNNNV